jgi:hypothetical protein
VRLVEEPECGDALLRVFDGLRIARNDFQRVGRERRSGNRLKIKTRGKSDCGEERERVE